MTMTFIENNYELVENYKDGYDEEILNEKLTYYFSCYDYIFGDWAYGKLRLKGFYDSTNKNVSKINDIKNLKKYIEQNCAYGCRYFLLKKVEGKK